MTVLVVDASVAVKWLIYEDLSAEAEALARSDSSLIAPRILFTEVANALLRKAVRGELPIDEAIREYGRVALFFDEIVAVDDVLPIAMRNAHHLRHPVYDMIYIEVARRRDIRVVTADRRLTDKVGGTEFAEHVVLLSEWRPA